MIYKRYELSQSLNGTVIVHIARNAAGNVIFRESSEDELKKAIDAYLAQLQEEEELAATKRKAQEEIQEEEETVPKPAPLPKRLTRGPDGKFISKSLLQTEEPPKKKGFWTKITG